LIRDLVINHGHESGRVQPMVRTGGGNPVVRMLAIRPQPAGRPEMALGEWQHAGSEEIG
jgi:hypothetical protein